MIKICDLEDGIELCAGEDGSLYYLFKAAGKKLGFASVEGDLVPKKWWHKVDAWLKGEGSHLKAKEDRRWQAACAYVRKWPRSH